MYIYIKIQVMVYECTGYEFRAPLSPPPGHCPPPVPGNKRPYCTFASCTLQNNSPHFTFVPCTFIARNLYKQRRLRALNTFRAHDLRKEYRFWALNRNRLRIPRATPASSRTPPAACTGFAPATRGTMNLYSTYGVGS